MWASAIRAIPAISATTAESQHEYKWSLSVDEIPLLPGEPMGLIPPLLNLINHFSRIPCLQTDWQESQAQIYPLLSEFGLKLLLKTWKLPQDLGLLFTSGFYLWNPSVTAHLVLTRQTPPPLHSSGNAESCSKNFLSKNIQRWHHSAPGFREKREENCRELGEAAPMYSLRIYLLSAGKFGWFWGLAGLGVGCMHFPVLPPEQEHHSSTHRNHQRLILASENFYSQRAVSKHPKLSWSTFSLSFSTFLVVLFLFPTLRMKAGELKTSWKMRREIRRRKNKHRWWEEKKKYLIFPSLSHFPLFFPFLVSLFCFHLKSRHCRRRQEGTPIATWPRQQPEDFGQKKNSKKGLFLSFLSSWRVSQANKPNFTLYCWVLSARV